MRYEVFLSANCAKLIEADNWEITEDKILFYNEQKVVAVFISDNILGFRKEL